MPTMNHKPQDNLPSDWEYLDSKDIETQWVERISLPIFYVSHSERKFQILSRTYTFIKHMMAELELKQNVDYVIIPPKYWPMVEDMTTHTMQIGFRPGCESYASMCVLMWERYKTAKIESNL